MQYELKKIDTWSVLRIVFIISLVLGFIISLFYVLFLSLLGNVISTFGTSELTDSIRPLGGIAIIFVIIFLTVLIAVMYTIIAAMVTMLYNFIAGWAGGVLISLEASETTIIQPPPITREPVL